MEVRNLVFSYDEQKCNLQNRKGILKTFKVEEALPNGKTKTVHTEIQFVSTQKENDLSKIFKFIKLPKNNKKRRAA